MTQDFKRVINDLNMTKPVSIAFGWGSLHTLPQNKFHYLLKTQDFKLIINDLNMTLGL